MPSDPIFYVVALIAVILVGIAKGGFSGMGALGTPLMALVIDPVRAAAILLPILIVQDVVGVWAFRKTWDKDLLIVMLPAAFVGIFLGWATATFVSVSVVEGMVGGIALLFGLYQLRGQHRLKVSSDAVPSRWFGIPFGIASGFTSQIAHAGGPPYQMWATSRRYDREMFAGTSALYFAAVNWAKVPAYAALGQFSRDNLILSAILLPVAVISTFAGVWLVRRVSTARFYTLIYTLMVVVGAKLIYDALA
ncbi:MAG: sulfite exporter TauE/SafE family protein [Sphingomonadaceae bacterium]